MNPNAKKVISGVSLAMAAAAMVACSSVSTSNHVSNAQPTASSTADLVHCYGVNVCGGHNDCKTASNACAGQASCKGTGFVAMPSKSCSDVGGKQEDSWEGSINTADLAHCYDVNICKGHNDCKTANNACAGHASCKGTGFVAMPSKSCGDIGGKVGA